MTKITWTHTSHIIIKINSKWTGNLNDNYKAIKVLIKIGKFLYNYKADQAFPTMTQNSRTIKDIDNLLYNIQRN